MSGLGSALAICSRALCGGRNLRIAVMLSASQMATSTASYELVREADVIVTMVCGDTCPVYPGKRYQSPVASAKNDWKVCVTSN
jgi:hypothetical protein